MSRTQNATRNIIFGFTLKLYQIVIPFLRCIKKNTGRYFWGIKAIVKLNSAFQYAIDMEYM